MVYSDVSVTVVTITASLHEGLKLEEGFTSYATGRPSDGEGGCAVVEL